MLKGGMRGWKDLGLKTALASPEPGQDPGALLYTAHCASCHQPDGKGLPLHFPPLAGDIVVQATDPRALVRAILYGATGMEIQGVQYQAIMPAFKTRLTDAEVAALTTYVRKRWAKGSASVTPDFVAQERNNPPGKE